MATVEQVLARLQRSAFRAKFHLSEQDRQYIADKGMETIQRHAADFVRTRLAPASIPNDGKQTPMRGHPVVIAQGQVSPPGPPAPAAAADACISGITSR